MQSAGTPPRRYSFSAVFPAIALHIPMGLVLSYSAFFRVLPTQENYSTGKIFLNYLISCDPLRDAAKPYSRSTFLRRNALEMTETEDRLIAAAAIMGESKRPVTG